MADSNKSATICYWSGTGNSYRVAQVIGAIAEESGVQSRILSFAEATSKNLLFANDDSFLTLVFPTHGFTAPWQVLKFAWHLPPGNGVPAYCVATRAGLKFGSLFVPGISGSATFIISLLLMRKGYHVFGAMSVDMPSNWYSLHPIQSKKSHEAIIVRAERKAGGFMGKALGQSRVWFTRNNLYEVIWGLLLLPISFLYLCFGKFFLAKLFFANRRCDGCGLCAKHCAVQAITMRGKDNRTPYWKYNCESCMRCAALCPQNAIEAGHSWGIILYFITAVPASAYLFSVLGIDSGSSATAASGLFADVVNILYFYPAIFISYFGFSLLIRVPFFNSLFTRTTLTHLPFWGRYREPGTKLRDLK